MARRALKCSRIASSWQAAAPFWETQAFFWIAVKRPIFGTPLGTPETHFFD
jgi:hypothetical protein